MPIPRVPPSFFKHFMRQPIIDSVSRSTALLPGVLDGSRFTGARLWNRSVFSVSVQLGLHGSGAGSASESATREIPSLF